MKKRLIFLRLLASAVLLAAWAPSALGDDVSSGAFTATFLHTNDVHAHVLPFNAFGSACGEEARSAGECFGGAARLATAVKTRRAVDKNTLLLDAGDWFQGSLFFTRYKGESSAAFMNRLGYDAMVPGNHEFDEGPETLADFVRAVQFPVVGTNLRASSGSELAGIVPARAVIQTGGEKIGVLGVTTEATPEISSPGPAIGFAPAEQAVAEAVQEFEASGIDKIVLLSHRGYGPDRSLAAAVSGVDVIVGGHSHTLLSDSAPEASGPYPTVVRSPSEEPVLIVSAGAYGKYLGRLQVTFDENGSPASWEGEPLLLDAAVAEDPEMLELVAEFNGPLEKMREETVGRTEVDLGVKKCRFMECRFGNLIADAMLRAAPEGTRIALMNGGGIRKSIRAGEVTRAEIMEALPFGNTLSTFEIRGPDLLEALENSVSRATDPHGGGTGRFLQVAGLRYSWNPEKPAGSRIVSAKAATGDGSYRALEPNRTYSVVTNSYLAHGGDGYTMFEKRAIEPYDHGHPLDTVVAAYLRGHSPVAPAIEGRIVRRNPAENRGMSPGAGEPAKGPPQTPPRPAENAAPSAPPRPPEAAMSPAPPRSGREASRIRPQGALPPAPPRPAAADAPSTPPRPPENLEPPASPHEE